jgi:hypothetical protein
MKTMVFLVMMARRKKKVTTKVKGTPSAGPKLKAATEVSNMDRNGSDGKQKKLYKLQLRTYLITLNQWDERKQ